MSSVRQPDGGQPAAIDQPPASGQQTADGGAAPAQLANCVTPSQPADSQVSAAGPAESACAASRDHRGPAATAAAAPAALYRPPTRMQRAAGSTTAADSPRRLGSRDPDPEGSASAAAAAEQPDRCHTHGRRCVHHEVFLGGGVLHMRSELTVTRPISCSSNSARRFLCAGTNPQSSSVLRSGSAMAMPAPRQKTDQRQARRAAQAHRRRRRHCGPSLPRRRLEFCCLRLSPQRLPPPPVRQPLSTCRRQRAPQPRV